MHNAHRLLGQLPYSNAAEQRFGMAGWQSGHAADCNSVYAGSIPTPASILS